jgi:hypothetical protein
MRVRTCASERDGARRFGEVEKLIDVTDARKNVYGLSTKVGESVAKP